MSVADLALQRNKYKHLSDAEWHWFLQQIEGRERTADKLPTFASIPDWWYPVRLSCEQCSSELTAKYKASLFPSLQRGDGGRLSMVDLTGGYGIDSYFLSEQFTHTDYVEQNEELCRIAAHNFANKPIAIHHSTAEDFLASAGQYDLIFLDPARRDSHGSKVFRLEDCTPNVVELLPTLLAHSKRLLIKLSPMLDLTQAVTSLSQVNWDIHIVAVKNEVKEVLLISRNTDIPECRNTEPTITAIDLSHPEQAFTFTREEEQAAQPQMVNGTWSNGTWIYEPNAAILKAGAYKLVGERFGLQKLDPNTHLYISDRLVEHFPGRVWRIKEAPFQLSPKGARDKQANVLCRNYPLTPEQLKKKLHLRDGGTAYVIGCRVAGKPVVLLAERVEDIHAEG